MPRVAAERAAQNRQRLQLRHAAAGLVRQRHHAIDVRIIRQRIVAGKRILLEHVGHHARDMGAAVHRGQDADVVAGSDTSVGTLDALECRGQIEVRRRLDVHAPGIILGELAHADILHVDVLARRDRLRGKADDLAIALDRFADGDGFHRHLMACGNTLDGDDALRDLDAGQQARARDQHAIVGMQTDHRCRGHGMSPSRSSSPMRGRGPAQRSQKIISFSRFGLHGSSPHAS